MNQTSLEIAKLIELNDIAEILLKSSSIRHYSAIMEVTPEKVEAEMQQNNVSEAIMRILNLLHKQLLSVL